MVGNAGGLEQVGYDRYNHKGRGSRPNSGYNLVITDKEDVSKSSSKLLMKQVIDEYILKSMRGK